SLDRRNALYEHFELARRAKFSSQPFELCLDCHRLRIVQKSSKQGHCSAKPAQSHAHLMHAFRIALDKGWLIVDDLLQAGETDDLESIARGCSSRQIDSGCFGRQFLLVVDYFVAAFRFAFDADAGRKRLGKLTRNVKQFGCGAALEFKLDLAQGYGSHTRIDRALVHGQCNRALIVTKWVDVAPHARLKESLGRRRHLLSHEGFERGALSHPQTRLPPRDLSSPFVPLQWSRMTIRLDCLNIASAAPPYAQH